jgi:dTDP-3-amino-3,4,6-trideoxy-alpha-D-glucose transaminase
MLPQAAPGLRIARYRSEIDAAIRRVVDSSTYILGLEVEAFEAAFATYLGAVHCIGVGSGTDAITLALRASGVESGDEVITVAMTATGTAQAILLCGARPVFVDIDPVTRCMDLGIVEAAITPRTTAIVPVHLYGHPVDMPRLMTIAAHHGLNVVEDCAQATGATIGGRKVGTFGHAAAFSFYPTKNLGCIGDGGAVVCADASIAAHVRSLRVYGWEDGTRISRRTAGNSRLDELQAAILSVLLPHLDETNAERRALAAEYRRLLEGLSLGLPPDDIGAVYHQFAITSDNREAVSREISDFVGYRTAVHYHPPLHQQSAFLTKEHLRLPITEILADQLLSLPIQPELVGTNLPLIAEAVRRGVIPCRES